VKPQQRSIEGFAVINKIGRPDAAGLFKNTRTFASLESWVAASDTLHRIQLPITTRKRPVNILLLDFIHTALFSVAPRLTRVPAPRCQDRAINER
jgi:hypothetical protein